MTNATYNWYQSPWVTDSCLPSAGAEGSVGAEGKIVGSVDLVVSTSLEIRAMDPGKSQLLYQTLKVWAFGATENATYPISFEEEDEQHIKTT